MENVYDILLAAELFGSYQLSETCLNLLASHIEELWNTEQFVTLLHEFPKELRTRVKDSIEDYLVHYGQTPRWEEIEQQWEVLFANSRIQ